METTEVKERPIIFSSPMVRAILEGRKTQTRRVIKPRPDEVREGKPIIPCNRVEEGAGGQRARITGRSIECPHGQSGDELWVRETFWGKHDVEYGDYGHVIHNGPVLDVGKEFHPGIDYCATPTAFNPPVGKKSRGRPFLKHEKAEPGVWWLQPPDDWNGEESDYSERGQWVFLQWPPEEFTKHPSIHMPQWASRITLEITDVRVERLQKISHVDVESEGASNSVNNELFWPKLWDSINAKRGFGWETNPFVWVLEFRKKTGSK